LILVTFVSFVKMQPLSLDYKNRKLRKIEAVEDK